MVFIGILFKNDCSPLKKYLWSMIAAWSFPKIMVFVCIFVFDIVFVLFCFVFVFFKSQVHFLYHTRQWKRKQTHRKCERNKLTCWLITGELWGLVWIFRWLWHSHHIKHKSIRSMRTISSVRPPCDVISLPPRFCWDDSAAETTAGRILLTWHTRTQRKDTHTRTSRIFSSEGVCHLPAWLFLFEIASAWITKSLKESEKPDVHASCTSQSVISRNKNILDMLSDKIW